MDNNENLLERFAEMDKLLIDLEKDFKKFKIINKKLRIVLKKTKILEDFYHSDEWIIGREFIYKSKLGADYYYSAGEDSIWNLISSIQSEKIKIMKVIASSL